jgi:gluconolactonase
MTNPFFDIRDDRFYEVVDTGAELERIADGFKFIEGPIWHPVTHHLIFSDIIGNAMYRWREGEGIRVFRKPSHMANGNTYDTHGRILTCEHATSRVSRTGLNGQMEVLATHYQDKELNSPNDIVVRSDGQIFFTDPNSGRGPIYGVERKQELDFQGVYRLDPETRSLTLLVDDFEKPNGLCFSLDEKKMFINDTVRQHIRAFDVTADGFLENGRLWAELIGEELGVADGMKLDSAGRLFCSGPGGIHVFDREANLLGRILVTEQAANFAWGDPDSKGLFITASDVLYRLRVLKEGPRLFKKLRNRRWRMKRDAHQNERSNRINATVSAFRRRQS